MSKKKERFVPSMLGSDVVMSENPFIVDDISGKQNKIIDAVKTPTNCLIYRNMPPSIHTISTDTPQVLNINSKNLRQTPVIPDSIRILIIKDNALKSISGLADHPNLEVIDASANLLETFEFDPPPPNLKALLAASNSIHTVASKHIYHQLQVLNLSSNRLTEIDLAFFPNLKTLNLSFNSFVKFEVHHQKLLEISIQNNSLTSISFSSCPSLTHVDVSGNQLTDSSIVEQIPNLTHFWGIENKFGDNWASFVVNSSPNLIAINGRVLKEGERAIHKDRVAKFVKQTTAPHPHQEISSIRLQFKKLKNIDVKSPTREDIEENWISRSKDKELRAQQIELKSREMPCVSSYNPDDNSLTIYGTICSDEHMKNHFKSLVLQNVPILKGSTCEGHLIDLASKNPTMLTLTHNFINTVADALFLIHFKTVEVIRVEGNPISKMTLFRPLLSYLMSSLVVINGVMISPAERDAGISHFQFLLNKAKNINIEADNYEEEDY